MRIFLFLFGKFKYFAILRQYRAAAGVDDRLFSTATGFVELFSDEAQLNLEMSDIFLTFAITNKKGYEKERNQMV